MTQNRLPYIDYLLSELANRNEAIEKSFGRHIHWGYWEDPRKAVCDDEDYGRAAENLTLELCRLADISEGARLLDAGCGFGGTIASLNERYRRLSMVGLNIDARQLARARQLVRPLAANEVEFRQGNACALPFPAESFDRVLAVECIFHFPSREAFFQEARRVLKPGGLLVLSDFVPAPVFLPLSRLGVPRRWEKYNMFGHYQLDHSIAAYRRLATQTGFASLIERDITRHTLPTYRYLKKLAGDSAINKGLVGMQRFLGALGLLNYYLLSFRKP